MKPCTYCGFVASRQSDDDCPAKPGNEPDDDPTVELPLAEVLDYCAYRSAQQ
jgi:hypothetical protein